MINDITLLKIKTLNDLFDDLYQNTGFVGVNPVGPTIHISPEMFLDSFRKYEINDRGNADYPLQLEAEQGGVKFFCLASQSIIDTWNDDLRQGEHEAHQQERYEARREAV